MDNTLIPADLALVIAVIRRHEQPIRDLGVTALWIYGSRARGDHRPDSDLDVMVDYDPELFSVYDLVGVEHIIGDETGFETHVATRDSFRDSSRARFEPDLVRVLRESSNDPSSSKSRGLRG